MVYMRDSLYPRQQRAARDVRRFVIFSNKTMLRRNTRA